MGNFIDITGQRFGRLLVLERAPELDSGAHIMFFCQCDCGKKLKIRSQSIRTRTTHSCGCFQKDQAAARNRRLRGEKHPCWKGGTTISSRGYRMKIPGDRAGRTKYVGEHALVMEEHLGRRLRARESVHHKNGNKTDNRLSNLELWVTGQPTGQRVVDLISYAVELLLDYAPKLLAKNQYNKNAKIKHDKEAKKQSGQALGKRGPKIHTLL